MESSHCSRPVWLEVGPGSNACLAHILLEMRPEMDYLGIEVNRTALRAAKKSLQMYRNASVTYGFVGQCALPAQVEYILHEIFGTIASAEGIFCVMKTLTQRYPNATLVPDYAETRIVPLALNVRDIITDPTMTLSSKLFRGVIPFSAAALGGYGILEKLDLHELTESQQHRDKIIVTRDGALTCLGLYIVIGKEPCVSSGTDTEIPRATNWANIGLPLPVPLSVRKRDILVLSAESNINTMDYHITLGYKGGTVDWHISASDLFGDYEYLHCIKGS